MLTITPGQIDRFADGALAAYRRELFAHAESFAPVLARAAGEENLRRFIVATTDEAMALGLQQRGPMRLLVELSMSLGLGFRGDPQYQAVWPQDTDPAALPMPFAQQLHERSGRYFEACIGDHQELLRPALHNLLSMSWEPEEPFEPWLHRRLHAVYPHKLATLGAGGLGPLIAACDRVTAQAGLASARGRLLVVVLALCFGAQVLDNPLYPWVAKRLVGNAPEAERIEQTLAALRVYVQHMIAHFEQGD